MQRRTFLKNSSYLAAGALLPAKSGGCQRKEKLDDIGLQLYTIRDAMQRDTADTIRRVADMGYDFLEGAGYRDGMLYEMSAKNFKALLDNHGLQMPSGHASWEVMRDEPERAIAAFRELDQQYVVIPWWPEEKRTDEGYGELVDLLNKAGVICQKYGMQLAYHNHDFEFNQIIASRRPMDRLLAETDAEAVKFELDLYWITRAGSDYQAYFKKHAGRFPLWHVKDMDDTPDKFFAAVGDGVIDWSEVFTYEAQSGMQWFFVEQDRTRPGVDIFAEIQSSIGYLEAMRY